MTELTTRDHIKERHSRLWHEGTRMFSAGTLDKADSHIRTATIQFNTRGNGFVAELDHPVAITSKLSGEPRQETSLPIGDLDEVLFALDHGRLLEKGMQVELTVALTPGLTKYAATNLQLRPGE